MTARLRWTTAVVAASTEHHGPAAGGGLGAQGRAAATQVRRNWPCFLATSTRSLQDQPPCSVLARVVVGFQCVITHGAVGEFFVPAE